MGFILLTDTCCDLPLKYVEDNQDILKLVGMPIELDGQNYVDDLGKEFKHEFFYQKLEEGVFPKTSQINTLVYLDVYRNAYLEGNGVIVVGLSSGLSGTINNAILAKDMLLEEYPDADITVIDTVSASGGLGVLVAEAISYARSGKTKDEVVDWINKNLLKVNHWFAIDDLEHLRRGGRIPTAIAIVGTALNIKPILIVAHDGRIKSYDKVRGRVKSIRYLYERFCQYIGEAEERIVCIGHAHCEEDAITLRDMILETHNPKEIIVAELSATIATHVGPGMIAIAFIGKQDRENK